MPALYELYQTLAQARKQRKISGNEVNAHSTGNNPLLLCYGGSLYSDQHDLVLGVHGNNTYYEMEKLHFTAEYIAEI